MDATDPAADEARAQVGVADIDGDAFGGRTAGFRRVGRGESQARAGHRGDLARQPDDRQGIAAVRLDVDVEDRVAVQLGERPPERRVGGEDQDPVGIGGQAELVARAEHPVADDAHLLGPLDPPVARQDGTGKCHRDPLAGRDVRRAADDLERLAVAGRDARQRQPVGARMALHGQQLPDDDVLPVLAPADDALDLHPEQRQTLGEGLGAEVDVDVLAQPAERDLHRNCSRKRRSSSRNRRRSVMPCLSILIRSGPIPNAKPWYSLGIEAAVLEHDRVDHPGTEDRHPAGPSAGRAAGAATDQALDVERDGRLGERVVAGPEAGLLVRAVHRLGELVEEALEVAHRGPLVDHQALDLEELRAVRGVDRLVAEAATGEQRADRRLGGLHHPDLAGRRMGPQQVALDVDVERVPQVARGVVGRDVEHLEVGQVVLDLRALEDDEPELAEDLGDLAHRFDARMEAAAADLAAGCRDVDGLGRQASGQGGAAQVGAALGEGRLDVTADRVRDRADARPVVRRQ